MTSPSDQRDELDFAIELAGESLAEVGGSAEVSL